MDPYSNAPTLLAAAEPAAGGGSTLSSLLPFVLLAVAFWFLLLRPQRKRAQEAAQIRNSLQVGAEVMTTAGLYGTVAHVDDDAVLLEVAPGVTNRYAKGAIARILTPVDGTDGADDHGDEPVDSPVDGDRDLPGDTRGGDRRVGPGEDDAPGTSQNR